MPEFKHSLLSVKKLIDADNCKVNFYAGWCIILHNDTQKVQGLGMLSDGHLLDQKISSMLGDMTHAAHNSIKVSHGCVETERIHKSHLWHLRLGHAPMMKLYQLGIISKPSKEVEHLCVTCPMGKLNKQPYPLSQSHAAQAFELLHINI